MKKQDQKFEFKPVLTKKQSLAWDALDRDDIKEVLYGGAFGVEPPMKELKLFGSSNPSC